MLHTGGAQEQLSPRLPCRRVPVAGSLPQGPMPQGPCRRVPVAGPLSQGPCRRVPVAGSLPQGPCRRVPVAGSLPQGPCRRVPVPRSAGACARHRRSAPPILRVARTAQTHNNPNNNVVIIHPPLASERGLAHRTDRSPDLGVGVGGCPRPLGGGDPPTPKTGTPPSSPQRTTLLIFTPLVGAWRQPPGAQARRGRGRPLARGYARTPPPSPSRGSVWPGPLPPRIGH